MGTSKILIDGVGIDLTQDTVAANKMLLGTKAHDSNGDAVTGTIQSKEAQTYTPGTTDQSIAAGQYLAGAQTVKGDANLVANNIKQGVSIFGVNGDLTPGIAPSGTKSITENGTYDVTEFASAAVNVVSLGANTEVLTVNVPSLHTTEFTLLNSAAILNHFDSPDLAILVKKMTGDTSTAGTVYLTYCGKKLLNSKSYGYCVFNSSIGSVSLFAQNSPINTPNTEAGTIYVTADGNLQFVAASPRVRAGDYLVCIWW